MTACKNKWLYNTSEMPAIVMDEGFTSKTARGQMCLFTLRDHL